MTSSATLKERKAAILKFSVPAIITFCEMIMRGYDAILNHRVHISIITGTMISNKYIENSPHFVVNTGILWILKLGVTHWVTISLLSRSLCILVLLFIYSYI